LIKGRGFGPSLFGHHLRIRGVGVLAHSRAKHTSRSHSKQRTNSLELTQERKKKEKKRKKEKKKEKKKKKIRTGKRAGPNRPTPQRYLISTPPETEKSWD
jgi:hypothetical protein